MGSHPDPTDPDAAARADLARGEVTPTDAAPAGAAPAHVAPTDVAPTDVAPADVAPADVRWMQIALGEARQAATRGEVPVGAVLVVADRELARAHNLTVTDRDPTAHAEILALRAGAHALGNHRTGGTLYVTLEPCAMCMGALIQARVERLVFGALDPKAGAAVSLMRLGEDPRLNHRFAVAPGVLAEDAAGLLRDFFRARR